MGSSFACYALRQLPSKLPLNAGSVLTTWCWPHVWLAVSQAHDGHAVTACGHGSHVTALCVIIVVGTRVSHDFPEHAGPATPSSCP
jgi:hypothetical protein